MENGDIFLCIIVMKLPDRLHCEQRVYQLLKPSIRLILFTELFDSQILFTELFDSEPDKPTYNFV